MVNKFEKAVRRSHLEKCMKISALITKRADTTRDGYVSIMDATAVQRYLARQIYKF